MFKTVFPILMVFLVMVNASSASAENYVNWKGNFWLSIPDDWEKVNYRIVDRFLAMTDTSRDIFDYEAVFAVKTSKPFPAGPYVVVTFEEIGELNQRQSDSVLDLIAASYADEIFEAPIVNLMSDLVPGKPKLNREKRAISFLSDMAYQPESKKKVWQYMRLNDRGLISLYFYCPDSLFEQSKPLFDGIVNSLSFENLREAAKGEEAVFTEIAGGDAVSSGSKDDIIDPVEKDAAKNLSSIKNILLIVVGIVIVFGLIWNLIIAPRKRKRQA